MQGQSAYAPVMAPPLLDRRHSLLRQPARACAQFPRAARVAPDHSNAPTLPAGALRAAERLAAHVMEEDGALGWLFLPPPAAAARRWRRRRRRALLGIVGVPGAGKSTIARLLVERLQTARPDLRPALVSMDGWHLPRAALDKLPDPSNAHARRGAPFTFDVVAFADKLRELAAVEGGENEEQEMENEGAAEERMRQGAAVVVPTFDHAAKDPVPDGGSVAADTRLVVVEGNYLCLRDHPDWSNDVFDALDHIIFLDVRLGVALERVVVRHHTELGLSVDVARKRVEENDMPNALLIQSYARFADWRLECDQ